MDITDISFYQSTSDANTPHHSKIKNGSIIWGSGESGYFTTPSSTEFSLSKNNFSNFSNINNNDFGCLAGETPRNTGIRLGKRAASLSDVIDNNDADDSLLVTNEQSCHAIFCHSDEKEPFTPSSHIEHTDIITNDTTNAICPPRTATSNVINNEIKNNPLFLLETCHAKIEEPQLCIITKNSRSCPVTPIKNTLLLKHTHFSPNICADPNALTPEIPRYFFSPVFQDRIDINIKRSTKKSIIKRLNLSAVSEKNNILYGRRPTTPPKHSPAERHKINKRPFLAPVKTKLDFDCREKLDIVNKLGERDMGQNVLEYLYEEDLCRFCLVSKRWRDICLKDSKANERRTQYIIQKRFNKENCILNMKKSMQQSRQMAVVPLGPRKEFLEIQNSNTTPTASLMTVQPVIISPPVSPSRAFTKAASKLEPHGRLRKCPKCAGPSQPREQHHHKKFTSFEYHCSAERCGYAFCELCAGPAHAPRRCPPTQEGLQARSPPRLDGAPGKRERSAICGKGSRRNLRRLL